MSTSCKTCGGQCEMGKSCNACGYDPMSHRDEQVVARVGAQGDGAFRGDRNRLWILTTERVVFLKNGTRSNESKLGGVREATYAGKRNLGVLGLLIAVAVISTLSAVSQVGSVVLLVSPVAMAPLLLVWAFWREACITIVKNDDSSFVERVLPGHAKSAEQFVQAVQDQLRLRRS